jgi:RNA polymerase sigma factor (sigma-70 family)
LTSFADVFGNQKRKRDIRSDEEWDQLVRAIRVGDEGALEELYRICRMFPACLIRRSLPPQEVEDAIHTVYLTSMEQIARGDLKQSSRLIAYLITIARRHVCEWIAKRSNDSSKTGKYDDDQIDTSRPEDRVVSHHPGPERLCLEDERRALARFVLDQLSEREREILQRFYVWEETEERIESAMGLTPTQFRLAKYRAKAKAAGFAATVLKPRRLRRRQQSVVSQSARILEVA